MTGAPVIEAIDLAKSYHTDAGTIAVLLDASLRVNRGEFVAIMGRSGSGKSTLLNLLGLLDVPDAGTLRLDGVDLSGADDDRRAAVRNRRIGFVFQQSFLLERATAVGNVMLPLLYGDDDAFDGAVTRAERALAAVGLVDRGRHRPTELSGGEQQRVAIARALINDPAVILADEPTGSLDEQAAGAILEILRRLVTDGRSVVLVTHDQAVAARADRTLTLDCGRLTS